MKENGRCREPFLLHDYSKPQLLHVWPMPPRFAITDVGLEHFPVPPPLAAPLLQGQALLPTRFAPPLLDLMDTEEAEGANAGLAKVLDTDVARSPFLRAWRSELVSLITSSAVSRTRRAEIGFL